MRAKSSLKVAQVASNTITNSSPEQLASLAKFAELLV
jgi:hypothetical protein